MTSFRWSDLIDAPQPCREEQAALASRDLAQLLTRLEAPDALLPALLRCNIDVDALLGADDDTLNDLGVPQAVRDRLDVLVGRSGEPGSGIDAAQPWRPHAVELAAVKPWHPAPPHRSGDELTEDLLPAHVMRHLATRPLDSHKLRSTVSAAAARADAKPPWLPETWGDEAAADAGEGDRQEEEVALGDAERERMLSRQMGLYFGLGK